MMMDPFLKHVVDITAQRYHSLLDISVISALRELAHLNSIRLLDVIPSHGHVFLRQKAWIKNDIILSGDEESGTEQALEPLAAFAGLAESLAQRSKIAMGLSNDGTKHLLWLPVWLNDKPISCLELGSNTPFSSQACSIAEGIMSVYRNFQSLLDYSERDSLTGLFNRKTFDEKLTRMASFADARERAGLPAGEVERRQQQPVKDQWLAVADIDHFKKVNDEYGHLYGDEVLILISNILKSSFRSRDRIFRFGGEEFVIMLRSVTEQNAHMVFERFRRRVEAYSFPQVGRVTVSLGFVRISGETPVVILGRADQALYYAKTNGRNQVCFYDDLAAKGILQPENARSAVEFF